MYSCSLKFGDRIAVISDTGEHLSYSDLATLSRGLGETVISRSLVFAFCDNSIGSFAGCVAFLNNGVVPLLLDVSIDQQLLGNLIATYKPEYLFLPKNMSVSFPGFSPCFDVFDHQILKTGFHHDKTIHVDLALLISTSGSTGSPKLVRQSYNNLRANGTAIVSYLGIDQHERPITTLPMQYTYGFSIINSHLLVGATILLTSRTIVEKGFWNFFREQQATSFGGVPYTFEMLKKLRFFRMDLPSLKTITQAGGKLSSELSAEYAQYAEERGVRFFVMYGQTEATARMSYLPCEYALSKCGSMGIAIPGGKFSLIDDDGSVIEENNQPGELVYRGANVTMGYAECREDLSRGDERGGVLLTGDIARRDDDGFYYISGRKKRYIKLFGNRINLDDAEHIVKSMVPEAACCGSDDKMEIFITISGKEDDVRQLISRRIGIHHSAFSVKVINCIPKNESGKTLYSKLMVN